MRKIQLSYLPCIQYFGLPVSLSYLVYRMLLLVVGCLLNVPATCECISGTDLLRQFDVLPH